MPRQGRKSLREHQKSDADPDQLLSSERLFERWGCGSPSSLWRAEADGLLVPRRDGRRKAYAWPEVWLFEGGLPPAGMESAYRRDLMDPEEAAKLCPYKASTLQEKAKSGEIPHRRVGSRYLFVREEVLKWISEKWT